MLGTTLTVTINGVAKVLKRNNSSEPYTATYFLADSSTLDYTLTVKHTIPKVRGASKESHLVRLDAQTYDVDGAPIRTQSTWVVSEVSAGRQNSTDLNYMAQGLFGFLNTANNGFVLDRDS
jgi:hypothetical protein